MSPPEAAIALFPRGSLWRKYAKIYRVSLIERLTYRGDFFLSTLLRFLPMLTTILLWEAIYTGSGLEELSGFSRREMIAYLLLVHITRMFSSMPGLAFGIARDIRDGSLKKYLLQPINMLGYLIAYRAAHKTAYIATTSIPYAILFGLCYKYFDRLPDLTTFFAYLASLLMAYVVGFYFEATMGMIGFWFLEVTSVLYVVNTVNFFVSGHMFPLDLLSPFWASVLKSLPFQYTAYFSAAVFLGKIQGEALLYGLLVQLLWSLAFIGLAHGLFRFGLRRYSAYGG